MLVDYAFVKSGQRLPSMPPCLYQYLVGRTQIAVRAERAGLSVIFPVETLSNPIAGLDENLGGAFGLSAGRVPLDLTTAMLQKAREASPREILFYLLPPDEQRGWQLATPRQNVTRSSCRPVDPFHPWGKAALIEVHSHNSMEAYFSGQDDRDEKTGFRIYAVLGRVNQRCPEIVCRVGVYGHFWNIPAHWVFDLPDDFRRDDDRKRAEQATLSFRPDYSWLPPDMVITDEPPY